MLDIKIDKGVVVTPSVKDSEYRKLAEVLEIGDSFLVKDLKERSRFFVGLRRHGLKLTTRTQEDGTIRIWCLGKPS